MRQLSNCQPGEWSRIAIEDSRSRISRIRDPVEITKTKSDRGGSRESRFENAAVSGGATIDLVEAAGVGANNVE
jgi:hypothetical protein